MGQKLNVPLPFKGLMVDRPAEYVDPRGASAIQNMETNRSVIRKRIGSTALGASLGERIQRFFELEVGTATRLFRVGLTKVEVLNKTTGAWSSVATAALTGTEVDTVDFAFPLLSGVKVAVYTNGIDVIKKCLITGNDAALGGTPPKVKFLQAFGSYLVGGLVTNDGSGNTFYSRIQWSGTGDPETWTGGNSGSVDLLEDPEDITGMGVFGDFLTVHKHNSIYIGQLVTTSAVFRFDRRATGVGTVANASIHTIPSGEQMFLAADGLRLFNGITALLVDSPVQDELRETMNPAYLYKAQSIFVEELDEYWLCVATGSDTEPQTIYKYNWRTRQMYKDVRTNLLALGAYLNTSEDTWDDRTVAISSDTTRWNSRNNLSLSPVVITGTSAGVTSKRTSNSNNDDGVAVASIWETKDFTSEDYGGPDMDRMMRWKGMELWAIGDTVTVSYSTDGGSTWTVVSTVALTTAYPTDANPTELYFDVVSSRIRFRFANSTLGESFTVKKYQLEATPRESRK